LRMFGSLMVVLGLIMLLFYLARRLRLKTFSRSSRIPQMRLLGTLSLAPKRALALVEFSDQWLIVGVGAESVSLLLKMERITGAEPEHGMDMREEKGFRDFLPRSALFQPWKRWGRGSRDAERVSPHLKEPWGQEER